MWKPYLAATKTLSPITTARARVLNWRKSTSSALKLCGSYIEHFAYDCLVWSIVCYDSPEGWRYYTASKIDGG